MLATGTRATATLATGTRVTATLATETRTTGAATRHRTRPAMATLLAMVMVPTAMLRAMATLPRATRLEMAMRPEMVSYFNTRSVIQTADSRRQRQWQQGCKYCILAQNIGAARLGPELAGPCVVLRLCYDCPCVRGRLHSFTDSLFSPLMATDLTTQPVRQQTLNIAV